MKEKHAGQEALSLCTYAPPVGSRWRHYKGDLYTVVAVGCIESTGEPFVAYRSEENGWTWARTLEDWSATVACVPRFSRI